MNHKINFHGYMFAVFFVVLVVGRSGPKWSNFCLQFLQHQKPFLNPLSRTQIGNISLFIIMALVSQMVIPGLMCLMNSVTVALLVTAFTPEWRTLLHFGNCILDYSNFFMEKF